MIMEIKEAIELLSITIPRPKQEQEALNMLIDLAYHYLELKKDYTRSNDIALLKLIIDCQALELRQIRQDVEKWKIQMEIGKDSQKRSLQNDEKI